MSRRTWKNKSQGNGGWNVADQIYVKVQEEKPPELTVDSVYLVKDHEMKYVGKVGVLHKFVAVKGSWSTTLSEWQLNNVKEK